MPISFHFLLCGETFPPRQGYGRGEMTRTAILTLPELSSGCSVPSGSGSRGCLGRDRRGGAVICYLSVGLRPLSSLASFCPGGWDASLERSLGPLSQSRPCLAVFLLPCLCPLRCRMPPDWEGYLISSVAKQTEEMPVSWRTAAAASTSHPTYTTCLGSPVCA